MKYILFFGAILAALPLMSWAAFAWRRAQGWLLTLLILSTAFGDWANINFSSMEEYRGPDRGFEITFTDLIAWSLCVGLVLRGRHHVSWLPYNTLVLVCVFAAGVFTTVIAPVPVYGAFTLFKLLRIFVIYWCVVNAMRVGVSRDAVWRGFVAVGFLITAMALKQKYVDGIYRVHGPFDHSNTIPLYLNLFLPALLLWSLGDRTLSRLKVALSIAAVFAMFWTIYATFSRAGLMLALFALFIAIVIANLRIRSWRVFCTSAAMMLLFGVGALRAVPRVIERFQEAPEASGEARVEFNRAAKVMARDSPFGVGLNNFSYVMTTEGRYRKMLKVMANEKNAAGVAHHIYWLTLAESGFLGLGLFLLAIARFAWRALWEGSRLPGPEGAVLWGFLLGFITVHLGGLLEWAFRLTPVMEMFAVVCGLSAAWVYSLRHRRGAALPPESAETAV